MKPQTIIFSSSAAYPVAQSLKKHLDSTFNIHLWREDFFGENRTTPLWTFFKKLFHYDCAIIILADDNLIPSQLSDNSETWIPKDNVIFELGATMARLGPQKTIMVTPDTPRIQLPGYFDDVSPIMFTYKNERIKTPALLAEATIGTANSISKILSRMDIDDFHSELPAQGLAHAYLQNFLFPVMRAGVPQNVDINSKNQSWSPDMGLTVTVIMPNQIMGRKQANEFFNGQLHCYATNLKVQDGRNLGIYALQRNDGGPLHILDIPTTLLTSEKIIQNIEHFWREKDVLKVLESDEDFIEALRRREILNFNRSIMQLLVGQHEQVFVREMTDVSKHILELQNLPK